MNYSKAVGFLVAFWLAACSAPAQQIEGFIRFLPQTGAYLPGSSTDPQFPSSAGWSRLSAQNQEFQGVYGATNSAYPLSPTFTFAKEVDAASPILLTNCATGNAFTAEVALRQASATAPVQAPYYTVTLSRAMVATIRWRFSSGDNTMTEEIRLEYLRANFFFNTFATDGTPSTRLNVNWDRATNNWSTIPGTQVRTSAFAYPGPLSIGLNNSILVSPTRFKPGTPPAFVALVDPGNYTGSISLDPSTGNVVLTNARPVGGPYTILLEVVDTDFVATRAAISLTVTSPPPAILANPDQVIRLFATSNAFPILALLANDSPGAIFNGLSSTNTTLGGTVAIRGNFISYIPPLPDPGTIDTFTYLIRDTFGQTTNATVSVDVQLAPGRTLGNLNIRWTHTGIEIELKALPSHNYQLQSAPTPQGPWTSIGGPKPGTTPNGVALWTNLPAAGTLFYRAYSVQ